MNLINLLNSPLYSYDEAWYGSIAKNMISSGNWLYSTFNGYIFTDHPPFGFWLLAISMKLFGISELSVRIPALSLGIGSIVLIYLLAKIRVGKLLAVLPSLMLASSLWFLLRMFSGNLDITFLFLYLLSIYLFELWLLKSKPLFLLVFIFSLTGLWLTKTLIGFSILPVLAADYLSQPNKNQSSCFWFIGSLVASIGLTVPWYIFNYLIDSRFLLHHFFSIGLRENRFLFSVEAFRNSLLYLRSGIGKWYYPALISPFLIVLTTLFRRKVRKLSTDLVWLIAVLMPFLLSGETQVWHLIPSYPPLFLLTATFLNRIIEEFEKKTSYFLSIILVITCCFIGLNQFLNILPLLRGMDNLTQKQISLSAKTITDPIYFKSTFLPTFIYYSEQEFVDPLWLRANAYSIMTGCLMTKCNDVFVVERNDLADLDRDKVEYATISQFGEYSIIEATTRRRTDL